MNSRTDRIIRISATFAALIVMIAAAILSWAGLSSLAVASEISPRISWMFPVAVDGAIVAGSLAVLHATLRADRSAFGWFVVAFGAGLSVWGNIMSVENSTLTTAVVHAAAPIALLVSLELVFHILRHRIQRNVAAEQEAAEAAEKQAERDRRAAARKEAAAARKEAPAPVPAPKPTAPRPVPAAVTGGNREETIAQVEAVMEALGNSVDDMSGTELVARIRSEVEGVTRPDLLAAGVLSKPGDEGRQHRSRVDSSWKRSEPLVVQQQEQEAPSEALQQPVEEPQESEAAVIPKSAERAALVAA